MKERQWIRNLIYIGSIGIFYFLGTSGIDRQKELAATTYAVRYELLNSIIFIFFGGIGIILGMEHLLQQFKADGKWKVNWEKLINMGLPSLFLSLSYIWIKQFPGYLFLDNIELLSVTASIVFGYSLITSFRKIS